MVTTPPSDWDFKPLGGRIGATALAVGGGLLQAGVLSIMFNPIALGGALGLSALVAGLGMRSLAKDPKLPEKYLADLPPEYAWFKEEVDALSTKAGIKPLDVKLATRDFVKMARPASALASPEEFDKGLKNFASGSSLMNAVAVTKEFLDTAPPEARKFVIAHELAHVKVRDSHSIPTMAKIFGASMTGTLLAGAALGAIAVACGFTNLSPLAAQGPSTLMAMNAVVATALLTGFAHKAATRISEYRADSNAVALGATPEGAKKTFSVLTAADTSSQQKQSTIDRPAHRFLDLMSSHPSVPNRLSNIQNTWDKVHKEQPINAKQAQKAPAPHKPGITPVI